MTSRSASKKKTNVAEPDPLTELGLHKGETIRFKKAGDASRWVIGKIYSAERDGSITIHDQNGAARSLRPERLEIQRQSARGRMIWQNLAELLQSAQQLTLFAPLKESKKR